MAGNIVGTSYNNLSAAIPERYPLQFIQKFYAGSITNYICNDNWEGEITGPGSTLHLREIPNVTVTPATADGDVQWQSIQATSITFQINYAFNGAYFITDIDRSQIDVDMEGALMNEMFNRLRLAVESTILGSAYASAANTISGATYGASTWASLTAGTANCITACNQASAYLSTGAGDGIDVAPFENRFLVVHPQMLPGMYSQPGLGYALNTGQPTGALYEGYIANALGFSILQSPLVPGANSSGSPYQAMAGHPEGITMGVKFTSAQTDIPLPNKFGVGSRCQNFFGFKVTKPQFLVNLQVYGA